MIIYILEDGEPRRVDDHSEWAEWLASADITVAKTKLGDVLISTVFLGVDHNFGFYGNPILFETMIFGGEYDDYQERYTTLEESMYGHERAVALVRGNREMDTAK